jgi:hypothetical protein
MDVEKSGGRDGSSQVGVVAAMRARDVSRPRDDEPVVTEPEPEPARESDDYRARSSARGGSTPEAS